MTYILSNRINDFANNDFMNSFINDLSDINDFVLYIYFKRHRLNTNRYSINKLNEINYHYNLMIYYLKRFERYL